MPSRKLEILVLLVTVLAFGHTIDHIARGDLRWPPTADSVLFLVVTLVIFTALGGGLYLYRKRKVGPGYWALVAAIGVVLGWLGHFSPFTDQPPHTILHAYQSGVGSLALACLVALMLVLIIVAVYAGYLWAIQRPSAAAPAANGR
jgi:hypothetical protein